MKMVIIVIESVTWTKRLRKRETTSQCFCHLGGCLHALYICKIYVPKSYHSFSHHLRALLYYYNLLDIAYWASISKYFSFPWNFFCGCKLKKSMNIAMKTTFMNSHKGVSCYIYIYICFLLANLSEECRTCSTVRN